MTTQEYLKQLMIARLGTSDDESAELISNIVDNANGGGGGSTSNLPAVLFNGAVSEWRDMGMEFLGKAELSEPIIPNVEYTVIINGDVYITTPTQENNDWVLNVGGFIISGTGFVASQYDNTINLTVLRNDDYVVGTLFNGKVIKSDTAENPGAYTYFCQIPNILPTAMYTVVLDGTVYENVPVEFSEYGDPFLGSPSVAIDGVAGNYPFAINTWSIITTENGEHNITIYGVRAARNILWTNTPVSSDVVSAKGGSTTALNPLYIEPVYLREYETPLDLKNAVGNRPIVIREISNEITTDYYPTQMFYDDNTFIIEATDGSNSYQFGVSTGGSEE